MPRQRKPKGARWKDYLTRRDLSRHLGVSLATLSRMQAAGRLPQSIVFNGLRLYRKADVEAWEKEVLKPKK